MRHLWWLDDVYTNLCNDRGQSELLLCLPSLTSLTWRVLPLRVSRYVSESSRYSMTMNVSHVSLNTWLVDVCLKVSRYVCIMSCVCVWCDECPDESTYVCVYVSLRTATAESKWIYMHLCAIYKRIHAATAESNEMNAFMWTIYIHIHAATAESKWICMHLCECIQQVYTYNNCIESFK